MQASVALGNRGHLIPATIAPGGTTFTVDWRNGIVQVVDTSGASGPLTATLSNPITGARYTLIVISGGTPRAITLPAVLFPGGVAPVFGANTTDKLEMVFDGTNYLATFAQAFA